MLQNIDYVEFCRRIYAGIHGGFILFEEFLQLFVMERIEHIARLEMSLHFHISKETCMTVNVINIGQTNIMLFFIFLSAISNDLIELTSQNGRHINDPSEEILSRLILIFNYLSKNLTVLDEQNPSGIACREGIMCNHKDG